MILIEPLRNLHVCDQQKHKKDETNSNIHELPGACGSREVYHVDGKRVLLQDDNDEFANPG
jgi:hypothetical protein